MADTPAYLRSLESQLNLSNIGFGKMFTNGSAAMSVAPSAAAPVATETIKLSDRKLKFMLVATHIHQFTGYSKVSYNLVNELVKNPWLEITHFGFQRHPQIPAEYRAYPPGVEVFDAAGNERPAEQGFGFKLLPDVIRKKEPDVVLIYNDMSIVARFLEEIRKSGIPRTFKIWVYIDQVYNTQLQAYLDILNRDADRVFAFTPYWKKCIKDQGITRPTDIILHGFDAKKFYPVPRELVRKNMNIPADAFLYMSLNRNQPRKRYDLLIMAFVELVVKYPTKPIFMLCICDKGDKGGWWLFEIYQRELKMRGVSVEPFGSRLMLSSTDMSFRDEDINMFYNAADVGVSSADGEGFGLCNFEQMGVGVPQVVPDIGGFKEFCNTSNSVLVKAKNRYYLPTAFSPVGGEALAVDPHDLCLGMEEYLLNTEKREAHGKAARETVLSYTWDRAAAPLVKQLKRALEDKEDA
jgi:glycosyltransferase involved in cell wall biosynthesis